jgi:predicted RNA-binding protein with PUA-like domain
MAGDTRYWLLKTEPESFSIDDLAAAPRQSTCWDGVRNYQARNSLRDDFKPDDRVLFYHSNADPAAIVGTAVVVREGYPDNTAWQQRNHHFDPKSTPEKPIWYMVDIQFESKFAEPLALDTLRGVPALAKMELLRRGSRLSVQPVTKAEFDTILQMAGDSEKRAAANRPVEKRAIKKRPAAERTTKQPTVKKRTAKK